MRRWLPFSFSPGRTPEPLFSPRRAAIFCFVRPYYAELLHLGFTARGPCHVAVSPLQVFRDCDGGESDDDDDGHGSHSLPLVYTVVQPLSKVSELGVFMIVNNKGKLATPQRSCYFISFFPILFFFLVCLLWMAIPLVCKSCVFTLVTMRMEHLLYLFLLHSICHLVIGWDWQTWTIWKDKK